MKTETGAKSQKCKNTKINLKYTKFHLQKYINIHCLWFSPYTIVHLFLEIYKIHLFSAATRVHTGDRHTNRTTTGRRGGPPLKLNTKTNCWKHDNDPYTMVWSWSMSCVVRVQYVIAYSVCRGTVNATVQALCNMTGDSVDTSRNFAFMKINHLEFVGSNHSICLPSFKIHLNHVAHIFVTMRARGAHSAPRTKIRCFLYCCVDRRWRL